MIPMILSNIIFFQIIVIVANIKYTTCSGCKVTCCRIKDKLLSFFLICVQSYSFFL